MRDNEPTSVTYIGYIGGLGGEAIQTFDLAASVAALGIPTNLVVPNLPRMEPFVARYAQVPNLSIVTTDAIRFNTGMQKFTDVWRTLTVCPAPVLHLHTGDIALPRMTLLALDAQKLLPRAPRVFATIHDAYPEMAVGSARARYWAQVANRRIHHVISPSRHGRQTQIGYGIRPDRSVTLYNGIDVDRFGQGNGVKVRRDLGIAADVPLVVATGRVAAQKRPLDAVRAFHQARQAVPDAQLVLVGTGDMEPDVEQLVRELGIADCVHRVGLQMNVPDFLAAADVWLCTSDAENFSLSVLEALAAGCPIVGTSCRGNDEVLRDGDNALTASVGDVETLGDATTKLLRDPTLRARLAQTARATAQNYRREDVARRHLDLYQGKLSPDA